MNDLKCVECGQKKEPMLVFVGTFRYEDGTIEDLPEGMHSYCEPCREKLGISDELNAGRDLRAEAKQVTLDAVKEARRVAEADEGKGLDIIMNALDSWIGGLDGIMAMLGKGRPERPQEVFDGVSDAIGEIDPATMTPSQALGLITTTNMVRDRIENWEDFVQRTYAHFKTVMSEDRARRNLVGFIK